MPAHKVIESLIRMTRQLVPINTVSLSTQEQETVKQYRQDTDKEISLLKKSVKFLVPKKCHNIYDNKVRWPFTEITLEKSFLPYDVVWFEIEVPPEKPLSASMHAMGFLMETVPGGFKVYPFASYNKDEWVDSDLYMLVSTSRMSDKLLALQSLPDNSCIAIAGNVMVFSKSGRSLDRVKEPEDLMTKVPEFFMLLYVEETLQFLHARNVTSVFYDPPDKLNKKRLKKKKTPIFRYHILGVALNKTSVRKEMSYKQALRLGILPLHTVRTYIATYTEDKPMFGRPGLYGRFVKRRHVRGDVENGITLKDYAMVD